MTTQASDSIIYMGKKSGMATEPLEQYLDDIDKL